MTPPAENDALSSAGAAADRIKRAARELGFDWAGVAPAVQPPGYPRFLDWLESRHEAGMTYMHRHEPARSSPRYVMEGVRSIVVVAAVYGVRASDPPAPGFRVKVARYARGADYHGVLRKRLRLLLARVREQFPSCRGRVAVDTAPLLERDFARLAGMGWIGKNTMLLSRTLGGYTLLGCLLLDIDIDPDTPFSADHCGTCRRCLDACPTNAFVEPYRLDANRCISYWTIESRGEIPEEYRDRLEDWLFGCDICQEVCPWNRKAAQATMPELAPLAEWSEPDPIELLESSPESLNDRLRGTALARTRREGLIRNALLIAGTRRLRAAEPAIKKLLEDPDSAVRSSARWALDRIASAAPEADGRGDGNPSS